MIRFSSLMQWVGRILSVSVIALLLSACEDGDPGAAGPPGPGVASLNSATELNFEITGVTINSAPVVRFNVTNQDGVPVAGFGASDLRFNIAKLVPGTTSNWQNYIISSNSSRPIYGSQERASTGGTLVDNKDGTFVYTFAADIANITCPGACTDADGNPLDLSYQPSLVHRVTIQQGNSAYPRPNVAYDFIPAGGTVVDAHEITTTETCNECHNQLSIHGSRTEVKLCVTCHNPGTWNDSDYAPITADFKVMIHKIHRGEHLPSVLGPDGEFEDDPGTPLVDESADNTPYEIGGHDYSTVVFPQDINNCDKCHTGAQGDNWKTQLSKAACSSCHDNVYFGTAPNALKPYETVSHETLSGVTDPADSACITCHVTGGIADSVEAKHALPVTVAATKFKFNIIAICGTAIASDPSCAVNPAQPTVTFSVSDPTGATTHGYGNLYDVYGATPGTDKDFEFGASASLNILTGWDSSDYNNAGGSGNRPARANSLNVLTALACPQAAGTPCVSDNADGTFTATLEALPVSITGGSGSVAMEGHPRAETVVGSGTFNISVPVAGEVGYFGIGADPAVERRVAVDIIDKCDMCHKQLSLHGANRADNAQLCVICHNPKNTDVRNRPKTGGVPDSSGPDGLPEQSIDMKVLIHGVHAGAASEHGFRENGLVVWGYNTSSINEYAHVRFPGILSDCTTCHNTGTYELDGIWKEPLQNGIQPTTVESAPNAIDAGTFTTGIADQTDDLATTPTAAVCSACHDGDLARAHMETIGGAKFGVVLTGVPGNDIATSYETCSVCHGPGKTADVNLVHGVE